MIGEIGWPSRGDRVGGAIASPAAQAAFVRDLLARTADRPLDYYLMEMFDQPWKQAHEGRAGAYWGMHHADRDAEVRARRAGRGGRALAREGARRVARRRAAHALVRVRVPAAARDRAGSCSAR